MHDISGDDPLLPHESECVRFVVSGHRDSLLGTYEHQRFRSRWASYRTTEVSAWCAADDPAPETPESRAPADKRYWSERPMRDG